MWVFLPDSMLSIVAPAPAVTRNKNLLMVRARAKGDIERVFPAAKVSHTPNRDYAYRALVPRSAVGKALAAHVETMGYGNFKDAVPERDRHDAYASAWGAMLRFQNERAPKGRAGRQPRLPMRGRHNGFIDGLDDGSEDDDRFGPRDGAYSRLPYWRTGKTGRTA